MSKLKTERRNAFESQFNREFGLLVKQKRENLELTQERLAAFLGCSRGTIMNLEAGKFKCQFLLGLKLARFLKLDIELLMGKAIAEINEILSHETI